MRISGRLCVVILLVISLQMVVGCGSGTSTGITPPPPSTYTIGGTVSGLVGAGLVLQNNSGDNQSVSANGAFTFSTSIDSGAAYSVTVSTEPTGQNCTVTNGSGKASANVTNIQVVCSPIYEWTWMGGSNLIVGISGPVGEPGNYGTLETASAANIPGGSAGASSWTGGSGNFWLFGGMDGMTLVIGDLETPDGSSIHPQTSGRGWAEPTMWVRSQSPESMERSKRLLPETSPEAATTFRVGPTAKAISGSLAARA